MGCILRCACIVIALLSLPEPVRAAPPDNPRVVYSFCADSHRCCPDTADCVAGQPSGPPVRGIDGGYYGVAGSNPGFIYRMDPMTHAVSVVHRFDPEREGSSPQYGLFAASDGSLYGALNVGPNPTHAPQAIPGNLFRISLARKFSVVRAFEDFHSVASVSAEDGQGNLYGVLRSTDVDGPGAEIFSVPRPLDRNGSSLRILHVFKDPIQSVDKLVCAADGRLYGTTPFFRKPDGGPGNGVVFRMTTTGIFTVLHAFDGGRGGESHLHGLVAGPDHALYGTVGRTVFRVGLDGRYAVIGNDALPNRQPPVLMPDGNFYGINGHRINSRKVLCYAYRLSPDGTYEILSGYESEDGQWACPDDLIRGSDDAMYGTSWYGGAHDEGAIYRYVPPLLD